MRWMRQMMALAFATGVLGLAAVGCEEAAEDAIDCPQICQTYRDCVDGEYNVDACRDDCEMQAEEDDAFRNSAKVCEACLDGKACDDQITCFDECPIER
ncbi:hypothetical protein [Chondromyces apiculatus]|nr:hypothetical protein [Chondromyces apiculatus]